MSPEWNKFKLLAEQEWMISLDYNNQLAPEIEMIKKLAGWDSNDTKIYLKFNKNIQCKIQSAIEYGLIHKNYLDNITDPHPSAPSLVDLSVDNIYLDFFGIDFDAQLMILEDLNGKGTLRVWNTTPTMRDYGVKTFPACTASSPSTDVQIIEDAQELLTKTCIPNGELLGDGYCRKHMETENVTIPFALIRIIICYFKVDFKTLDKYWISKE